MFIRDVFRKLLYGNMATSDSYLEYLRQIGASIGEGTTIFCSPRDCVIDTQNPYLLSIGKNVQITRGVILLTHDYSWSVIKGCFGEVCGGQFPLTIGDNVFIGMNAVLLGGTQVGNNVVIGAGSVVKGHIPSNTVVAGNPARVICTIEEYRDKRRDQQLDEAYDVYLHWLNRYGTRPDKSLFREYFWLFESAASELPPLFSEVNGYIDAVLTDKAFNCWEPRFSGFEEFENYCLNRIDAERSGSSEGCK